MKIVFFGSPDFAAASLAALLVSRHEVVGVITQPDRPAGRGLKLEAPAVKKLALAENLPIFQPEKVNAEETYRWLAERGTEQLVVVAYGEFLGSKLLGFCKNPPINVHPSLLPDLRGAAPMQWSLLKGYESTGVSTQFMVKEMDAGDVLLQMVTPIFPEETAGELQERLKIVGADLLVKTLDLLEEGKIHPRPQDSSKATMAPLLSKEMGEIDWAAQDAFDVHCKIRGLNPWPCAYAFAGAKRIKLLRSKLPEGGVFHESRMEPGEFYVSGDFIFVRCKDRCLVVKELQPEGKRPMLPREFSNGMKSQDGKFRFDAPL